MAKGRGCGCVLNAMHGRSRMTKDPRIPTMQGRSTSGFHQAGSACLHQEHEAPCGVRRVPIKQPLVRRTFLQIDDSVELTILFSGVATSRDSNGCTM